jgi:hypothetical protein
LVTLIPDIKLGIAVFTNIFFTDTDWRPNLLNRSALELLIPAIKGILARHQVEVAVAVPADWKKYTGRYSMPGLAEIEIKIIDGKMVVVRPGASTEIIARLTPEGEHKFRINGGHLTGELAIFELNETDNVTYMKLGSFTLQRK